MILVLPEAGTPIGGIICKVTSQETEGIFTVLELTLQKGQGAPLHVHYRETETFVVMEGTLTVECDGVTHDAPHGSVVVLPKESRHSFRNEKDSPCRVIITAVPGGLDNYFAEINAAGSAITPTILDNINANYGIEFLKS